MLYRIFETLDVRGNYVEAGCVDSLRELSDRVIGILMARQKIAPISPPPMDKLPGWGLRAERFGKVGIDVLTFLEMSDDELAALIECDPRSIAIWRMDLRGLLGIGPSMRRHG